jgi:Uma2 family endonuclease
MHASFRFYAWRQVCLARCAITGAYSNHGNARVIPVSEYLKTTYRPDCDYIDGHLKERNQGEKPHSAIQSFLVAVFFMHRSAWGVRGFTEQRVQVSESNYRIPDVCVLRLGEPPDPIVHTPPLICIEVLSSGDSLSDMQERIDDYLAMGVENIWLLDPVRRHAWFATANGLHKPANEFAVPGTPIRIPLADIYAELDDLAAGR